MTFKEEVYNYCVDELNGKMNSLQRTLLDLKNSAANETKSTAGDKHETALAMLQIEQANTSRQLEEMFIQKLVLNKLNALATPIQTGLGSLVKTNKGFLYISIALGKIKVNDIPVIALSMQSPLGKQITGLQVNDQIELNGIIYIIEAIY